MPFPADFVDIPYRARRYMVELELEKILRQLPKGAPTAYVNHLVAQSLGRGDKETAGLVLEIARTHPQAKQDGKAFTRYGRTMRGYNWYPTPAAPKGPVVDDSDW